MFMLRIFYEFLIFHPSENHFWVFDVKANAKTINRENVLKSAVWRKAFFWRFCMKFHYFEVIYAWTWTWCSVEKHWKAFFSRVCSRKVCFAAVSTKVLKKQNCKSHSSKNSKKTLNRFRGQEKTSLYRWKVKLKAVKLIRPNSLTISLMLDHDKHQTPKAF